MDLISSHFRISTQPFRALAQSPLVSNSTQLSKHSNLRVSEVQYRIVVPKPFRQRSAGMQAARRHSSAADVLRGLRSPSRKTLLRLLPAAKEPCREQDAQGHFVAAENYNQLPHEYNLSDDSTEPNKRQSRFNGWCRPLRMAHDDVLLRCLHRAKLEFSWLSKASTWEECAAIEESWRGRRIRLIHVYKRILILSELFTLFLDWL